MTALSLVDVHAQLAEIGFASRRATRGYQFDQFALEVAGRWASLTTPCDSDDVDPLLPVSGGPGLWKTIRDANGLHRRFDVSLEAETEGLWDDSKSSGAPESALQSQLHWALATAAGAVPVEWSPPAKVDIDEHVPDRGLAIQMGPHALVGELTVRPSQFAIRFEVVKSLSGDLPQSRAAWLRALLLDAQRRWRMVRFEISGEKNPKVVATIDLTGIPHSLFASLASTALDTLGWAVEHLIKVAVFVADPAASGDALNCVPINQSEGEVS